MATNTWPFRTDLWALLSPNLGLDLRVFPIDEEGDIIVLLSDHECKTPIEKTRFERMVRTNVGREVRVIYVTEMPEMEFSFDELLDDYYGHEMPQIVSVPVASTLTTMLIVDPDTSRRKLLRSEFKRQGYRVSNVRTLDGAVEFVRARRGLVRTVFIASNIPEGFEEAKERIREANNEVAVCDSSLVLREIGSRV